MGIKGYILVFANFLYGTQAFTQTNQIAASPKEYSIDITRSDQEIIIDGVLSDTVWSGLEPIQNFWMNFPVDNEHVTPAIQTIVKLTYDDQFLYLGVVCHDNNGYVIRTLKRDKDFWDGDTFAVVIDPMNQRTNGFVFGVNPAGVQMEALVSGQSQPREIDDGNSFNVAWDNKWYSAVKVYEDRWIAEMAIPFKTLRFKESNTIWRVNFTRGDKYTNSFHVWAPVPIQFRSFDLGFTGSINFKNNPDKPKRNISIIPYTLLGVEKDFQNALNAENNLSVGLDAKVVVTPSLNLDLTVNPDFSQVEVDEQVTNLTRFDIQFPEQRLFFLENSDLYEDFGIPPMRPFFSRRIGLDKNADPIPILYGMRLSGSINNDLRIGVMNLQTKSTDDFLAQNYTSVSGHQQILQKSVVKGYFHNRSAINSENKDFNRVWGVQTQLRSNDGKWQGFTGYGKGLSAGLNTKNYLYYIGFGYDSRNLSFYSNLAGFGDNYRNDFGWMPIQNHYDAVLDSTFHVGMDHWYSRASYTIYSENNPKIISHQLRGIYRLDKTSKTGRIFTNELTVNYELKFENTSLLNLEFQHSQIYLLYPFSFNKEGLPLPEGAYNYNLLSVSFQSDARKKFYFISNLAHGGFFNGNRTELALNLNYRVQPWGNIGINLVRNFLKFPAPYKDNDILLISPKLEIGFSKYLFWTTFLQYNTQGDNFNVNSRIQWRFQPMSDLFIVYTDDYAIEGFGPKFRSLVVKLNYWLNL